MKLRFAKYALFLVAFLAVATVVDAQQKKKPTKRTKTTAKKSTTKKTAKPTANCEGIRQRIPGSSQLHRTC